MRIEGKIFKNAETGNYYAVEVPALGIHTQGKSKKEAYEMAKDAIETVIDVEGFQVSIQPQKDGSFAVSASDMKPLISKILKQKRSEWNLTAKEVADKMGEKSITGYLRYEQGKVLPTIEKLSDIMTAIDPSLEPILKIG